MGKLSTYPVIDLFAGPGGLGEGFSAFQDGADRRPFPIGLSIEKDASAHQTLRLRSFYRQFPPGEAPELYYQFLRGEFPLTEFPDRLQAANPAWFNAWQHAGTEAIHAELGGSPASDEVLCQKIDSAVKGSHGRWVLIGGPPCQAYSIVGRSRNKGKAGYQMETDHRSSLYRQYLRIIADHWPAVFVMENVKGMLSAKLDGKPVFDRIIQDLKRPRKAMGQDDSGKARYRYRIEPIVTIDPTLLDDILEPRDFIVECEKYGVPQQRHRVILVGIREDLGDVVLPRLRPSRAPTVKEVIGGMPRLTTC